MNKKVISLTFVGWMLVISVTMISLQGCDQDDCGSFGRSEISSLELDLYAVDEKMSGQTQDQFKLIEYRGEEVSYDSILIGLELIVETFSESIFGLTSSFACSPPAPPQLDVAQLSITSDVDYNDDYPAGENLVNIFNIQNDLSVSSGKNLKSYIEKNQGEFYGWERYYLYVLVPPSELSSHKFQIQFTLRDSSVISMTTEAMLIR